MNKTSPQKTKLLSPMSSAKSPKSESQTNNNSLMLADEGVIIAAVESLGGNNLKQKT